MSAVLHEVYLPFSEQQLREHFAPVAGDPRADPDRHLAYYLSSLRRLRDYMPGDDPRVTRRALQVQKDERFWVAAALMALYHGSDRSSSFASLLEAADVEPPGQFSDWGSALDGELQLFFEVGLNSPEEYRRYLKQELDQRSPIPYVREAAGNANLNLEGATQVDAMLIASDTGVGVLFEAKVLSDCSATVTYDVLRNQLARNIDVMLDRQPTLPTSAQRPRSGAQQLRLADASAVSGELDQQAVWVVDEGVPRASRHPWRSSSPSKPGLAEYCPPHRVGHIRRLSPDRAWCM